MTHPRHRAIRSLTFAASLLALGLSLGCSSTPDATMSDQKLNIDQAEPKGGVPEAPPLGAPRPKLAPDEVIKKQKEEEERRSREEGRPKLGGPTGK